MFRPGKRWWIGHSHMSVFSSELLSLYNTSVLFQILGISSYHFSSSMKGFIYWYPDTPINCPKTHVNLVYLDNKSSNSIHLFDYSIEPSHWYSGKWSFVFFWGGLIRFDSPKKTGLSFLSACFGVYLGPCRSKSKKITRANLSVPFHHHHHHHHHPKPSHHHCQYISTIWVI